jgi:serine/threonine protein kinase
MGETVLFGRYRLIEPAGSGGSAQVWRALDTETGDEVAVKRLHPVVFADASGRQRLEREFKALRGLDAPHVVRVRELHVTDDEAALVLDYVDGRSVAERLSGGPPFSAAETLAVIDDVAEALAAAHGAGIVHRDVTPGNILLSADNDPKISDFGLAMKIDDVRRLAPGVTGGTPVYMSPEQASARHEAVDGRSDVYGLGAVLHEVLVGRPPFSGTDTFEILRRVSQEPFVMPDGVEAGLGDILRRALEKDPAGRFPSMADFASALEAWASGRKERNGS